MSFIISLSYSRNSVYSILAFLCLVNLPIKELVKGYHLKKSSDMRYFNLLHNAASNNKLSTRIVTRNIKYFRLDLSPDTTNNDQLSSILSSGAFDTTPQQEDLLKELTIEMDEEEAPRRYREKIGTSLENSPTLVLNADYTPLSQTPLSLWHWQDSLRAIINNKAVVVTEYSNILIRSVSCSFKLPSVIALKSYYRKPDNVPVMTRRFVYLRDGNRCQYCWGTFPPSELSLDHVIPRAYGGKLTWTNTVTACYSCNFKKGNTLPEDLGSIGMKLRGPQPYAPSLAELHGKACHSRKSNYHPHWVDFL